MKLLYYRKEKLFEGIEMIVQAFSVCSVKVSCEFVLESLGSVFENHFNARRNRQETSSSEG